MASKNISCLASDLLVVVFCKLGVECLVRCSFVCKPWNQIINSTSFVKFHLTCQKTSSTANKYILHKDYWTCTLLTDSEPIFDGTKRSRLYYSPELIERDINVGDRYCQLRIHGICDGLLCISSERFTGDKFIRFKGEYCVGDNIHLWNPICRKAKKLPELKITKEDNKFIMKDEDESCPGKHGFEPHQTSKNKKKFIMKDGVSFGYYNNDYKVIVISYVEHEYIVFVYSLTSNCWNIIHTNSTYLDRHITEIGIKQPTKFVNGIAYMMTDRSRRRPLACFTPPLTICFDLRDETIQQFKCPEEFLDYRDQYTIEAYGESIAALGCANYSGYLAVWILCRDELSSKSLWEKRLVIEFQPCSYAIPIGFLYNDKYMVRETCILQTGLDTKFFLYDLKSQEVTEYRSPEVDPYCCKIDFDCVESLLLLTE